MIRNYYETEQDEVMVMERPLIDPDFSIRPKRTFEEVWDRFCKELGKRYGLNDIRDAR